jgi:LacI family transcriptional regulator
MVEKAIEELSFRPNHYAKNLESNKSNMIGIIVPNLTDEFYLYLTNVIEQNAAREGYLVVILTSKDNSELERKYIEFLYDKRVDGIVLTSAGGNEDILLPIRDSGTPVVFVDRKPQIYPFDSIYVDKKRGAYLATAHLIECGHRKIALVTGPKGLVTNVDRFNGFVQAMYDHNIPIQNDYIRFGTFSEEFGLEFMQWFTSLSPEERPTAVLSGSTVITYGCLYGAARSGISIPDDLSMISYGNLGFEELINPKITYIYQMSAEVSEAVSTLILEKIKDPMGLAHQTVLTPHLVLRNSVINIK